MMHREQTLIVDIALVSMMAIPFVHSDLVAVLIGVSAISAIACVVVAKLQ